MLLTVICMALSLIIISYLSSNFSSSSFALDATVFTAADDTLVSTALLLFSNLTLSFSDDAVDDDDGGDGFVVAVAVAAAAAATVVAVVAADA